MSISERILADFAAEADHTRSMLRAVPEDKLDWKPHEKSWTLRQLVGHLAENPAWLGAMLEDEMDFAAMPEKYRPYEPKDSAELLATFEKNVAAVGPSLEDKDDAFLCTTWTMRNGDQILAEKPKHAAIREILVHHQAHHRGQVSVYLRLLDCAVPKTYGPTADDPSL